MQSLFGAEFEVKAPDTKGMLKKISDSNKEVSLDKALKSKKISFADRIKIIKENVYKILGKQRDRVMVIKDINTFNDYITEAIKFGRIAVDTETNNSLDPVTCKIAGLCLYAPGQKQAYIPINHRNPETKERLAWQVTEEDCKNQLQRIIDANTKVIMHNGKFDYEVLKCTCNIKMPIYWDTIVAARLLNENEPAALKLQYISKIDPTQSKYDIESLFEGLPYVDLDPELFALYAATDSFMTDKLFEYQELEFSKPEYDAHLDLTKTHQVNGLRWLFHNVEMPIVTVTAEMELAGVSVDKEFGKRLHDKYTSSLDDVDKKIQNILKGLESKIAKWKLTKDANDKTIIYVPKKTKMTLEKIEKTYPEIDEQGNRFKYGKSKVSQLDSPINLASPTQLAILLYDILKAPTGKDRATGEEELQAIIEKVKAKIGDENSDIVTLCELILERRGIVKLLSTYIDVIPSLVDHWPDGRIRFHMNSLGTDTGRYSSGGKLKFMENDNPIVISGINIQNIPSHTPEVRLLFQAAVNESLVETNEDNFTIPEYTEIETTTGWKYPNALTVGDLIIVDEAPTAISAINKIDTNYTIYFN